MNAKKDIVKLKENISAPYVIIICAMNVLKIKNILRLSLFLKMSLLLIQMLKIM